MDMELSHEVARMVCLHRGPNNGPAPIPEEGRWVQAREVKDISGLTHGVGWCAPQQGACKLTLNVKQGIIEEALIETVGCTGMTHSAAMAAEILPGKTILEALNVDLVCDAINVAMRQTAFSEDGLPIGAGMEDLGKGLRSVTGTMYGTSAKGPRYMEMAEGYVTRLALDENDEIIGYEFVKLGPMMDMIADGKEPGEALKKCTGNYGRFAEAVRIINPRTE
jgi:NifU-like protein involved in Fe-S cluster formation